MTKPKSTKRALLSSGLALIMCVSMLIGSTFAWFTDEATTGVNRIQSGKLDVALEMWDGERYVNAEGETLNFIAADGNEDILWEPGCTYKLPALRVVNKGNLALKYSIQITGINGDAKLNEAIDWTITYPTVVAPRGLAVNGFNDGALFAEEASSDIVIQGHMKEDAGNEYQGLSITGIAITVYASQLSAEEDSFGSDYDANAPFTSYWDGVTVGEVPELVNGERHITNAAELAAIMAATTTGNSSSLYVGETLVLDCDVDFGGKTISGIGGHNDNVAFTFDGNGHTISNFVINGIDDAHKEPQPDGSTEYRYAGLFQQFNGTVKDLTVKNATVIGNQMVGVIASNVDNGGKIINCKVYDSTVIGARKVGAIAGYIAGAGCEISGCYAENVNVYATSTETNQSAEMVGYTGSGSTLDNETPVNVNVYRGTTLVSTAAELATAIPAGGAVVIMNDIDMNNAWNTAYVHNCELTVEGLGHKITSLNKPLIEAYGLSNLTINAVTVVDSVIGSGNDTWSGVAALVQKAEWCNLYMNGCSVKGTTINGNAHSGTAALVGYWIGGGEIKNCAVEDCIINSNDAAGAIVGHRQDQSATGYVAVAKITDCDIKNVSVTSGKTGADNWRVGTVIGTVSTGAVEIAGCEIINSTVAQTGSTNPNHSVYGRISGGSLTVDGIAQ